jgi:FMN hydrolase / 5-amino-6-(5-phospho-D-ribitylamino)uracil phosphatase
MSHPSPPVIRALTLDLDDTLWPIAPVIDTAERALHAFLLQHCPQVCERYPLEAMRALRERVATENPHLAHDYSEQRRRSLAIALADGGGDPDLAEAAYAAFIAARNTVDLFPDVLHALSRLSANYRLAALTNGNADLDLIGLSAHFEFNLAAREHGAAKPSPCIFHAACARLECPPEQVLHVGDHPWMDVGGAAAAGMPTVWINRFDQPWPDDLPRPTLEVTTLTALADWLDAGRLPQRRFA